MIAIARRATSVRASQSTKQKLLRLGIAGLVGVGAMAGASAAQAASTGITQVVIQSTGPAFGGCTIGSVGTFNVVKGYAVDVIDPSNPLNAVITDIQNAQKDANGLVDAVFNFYIILPSNLANGNGKIIADIPNRSGKTIASPNRSVGGNDPAASAVNCSNTFWWPQGYATVDAGWEADVASGSSDPTLATNTNMVAAGIVNGNNPATTPPVPLTTMPLAVGQGGTTLTGPSYEYIVTGANVGSFNLGGGLAFSNYPATPLGGAGACAGNGVLTHRMHLDDTPTVLPQADWQYNIGTDGNCDSISLTTAGGTTTPPYYTPCAAVTGACFVSQDIYELSYTAANPTVNGVGHALIRDFYSWLKGNSGTASQTLNPFGTGYIKDIYSWTSSQPARTLNDYIHLGFNGDLGGKRVIDGMVNWIGAGAGISMNYRWSHTTETERNRQQHLWVESFFPFADVSSYDPISDTTDGRYVRCTANNTCPLMNFNQYSANEYWVKTASLYTTDPTGTFDLPDNPLSRRYYMSGLQHGGGTQTSKANTGVCQNYNNPTDAEFTERALWRALDQAVAGGLPPPPSQIPTLAAGTLVTPESLQFPHGFNQTVTGINNGNPFPVLYTGLETTRYRFNMGPSFYDTWVPTINPPVITPPFENNGANGAIYPSYVPQVNADGNDVSGIRMPELLVPLATYAGWNYRASIPLNDGPDGCESTGSYFQFPTATGGGDPRATVSARYPTYGAYVNAVVAAVDNLVWNRFFTCGVDVQTELANKLAASYTSTITQPSNQQPVITNQDWTYVTGTNPTTPVPPSLIPACNGALTHNFNGATGQLGSGVPLVAGFDGNSDVLWRDNSGNVAAWLMNGAAAPQGSLIANVPANWSIVGLRDFNFDGNTDILWRDNAGNVSIWFMNGTQVQSSVPLGNMPTNWSVAGTGAFNGLSGMDIFWMDAAGDVVVWVTNGSTFTATTLGNVGTSFVIAGTDNHGDVFWRNTVTGDVAMWVLSGTKVAKTVDLGVVPLSWTIAGIGDFAGTGSYDILWRDNTGNVAMWLMNGTQITSSQFVGNVPLQWVIAQTGDFNGDGNSDILWTDSSGDVAVWFMNGATPASVAGYGSVGPNWRVQALNSD